MVSADRSTIALVTGDTVEIWSTGARSPRATVTTNVTLPDQIALSRDGRLLAVLSGFNEIEIWDVARNTRLGTIATPLDREQRSGALQALAFSPDSRSLAVQTVIPNGRNTLAFWDLTRMRRIREISADLGYDPDGAQVLFAPDGRTVTAAPNFGRVGFPSGRVITKGVPHLQVDTVGDDGRTLYSFPNGYRPFLRLRNARSLRPEANDLRTGPVAGWDGQTSAVSPDGRLFATLHETGIVYQLKIWDIRARTQLGVPLTGLRLDAVAVTFTPEGSALVAIDKEGRVFTYTVAPLRLMRALCAESGGLTRTEWKRHIPDAPYRRTC
ncbi:WD40 repeat domain-containing protein [Actinomadura rayongensis]|uniref:WD40 repeat domain-containing protein n=1 Tax=Actinomadura rayongensis TaxID=1429076 RepID=A0A6I4WA10_9ACTN|nr:WD40 repeat domain-containing protein [Actinomadura rayongensis]MXQ67017.1 hypothetical protein [Actinomadura rayongensis]